jgi:hypothetical protein
MTIEQLYSNYDLNEIKYYTRKELSRRQYISFEQYLHLLELTYNVSDLQLNHLKIMCNPKEREVIVIRSRGGSKTFDAMLVGVYYAYLGFHVIFWSPSKSQMEQPQEYLELLVENNFLSNCIKDQTKLRLKFKSNGWIKIKNLTQKQARSPRCDLEIFDEEAQADESAYDASSPVLSVSRLKKIIHLSTPIKGSIFENNYKRMKDEHKPILIMRWDQCSHLNQDAEFMLKELKTKSRWWVRQEYFCSFEAPAGRVFENVMGGSYDITMLKNDYSRTHICYGLDWNPSAGHYISGVRYSDDYSKIYCILEKNLGTNLDNVLNIIFDLLEKDDQSLLEIEDGGTNSGYCDALFREAYKRAEEQKHVKNILNRIYRRAWDSAGKNKHQSINNLMPIVIYCDEQITPQTHFWLTSASWDSESSEPKLLKDSEQHPLDAFLHSSWIADRGVNHYSK